MRISGFMHGSGLIKRLYERILRSVDEMYRMTTSFLQGEVAALSHGRRKASSSWKPSEGGGTNRISRKASKTNKDRIVSQIDSQLLTKTPKEIFALEKGKFKAPPPMVTPVEKRDPSKYCEFHSDMGHNTNECMQLRKQIDEMIKAGKLSGQAQDYPELLSGEAMSFPPLSEEDGTESPMIIEVEMGGHFVTIPTQCNNRQAGHKKNPRCTINSTRNVENPRCTINSTRNVKLPGYQVTIPTQLQSSRVIPMECAMISGPSIQPPAVNQVLKEKINIAIHPEYPQQTVAIGST
ncbi:hypothetical protein Tco_1567009, partial [Tanacetum coccineum]